MKKKQFRRFAWGGFSDNKLSAILIDSGWGGFGQSKHPSLAVFLARKKWLKEPRVSIQHPAGNA